ncbi:hypothetical protein M752DRAFT_285928 [Aspergillus phoenicis ATCC 13157]|nr:hypothetical protein M752DRAFT_285928 [Aspergillus phoenicis ATCC 13157]
MQQPPVPLRSGPSQSRRVIALSSPAGVDAFDIKWAPQWGNAAMGDPARRRLAARIPSECSTFKNRPFPVLRTGEATKDRYARTRHEGDRQVLLTFQEPLLPVIGPEAGPPFAEPNKNARKAAGIGSSPFSPIFPLFPFSDIIPSSSASHLRRLISSSSTTTPFFFAVAPSSHFPGLTRNQSACYHHFIHLISFTRSLVLLLQTSSGANLHSSRAPLDPRTNTPALTASLHQPNNHHHHTSSTTPSHHHSFMLLPSALPSDMPQQSTQSHLAPNLLLNTPPPTEDDLLLSGNGLLGTSRALQSLLNISPASIPRRKTPPRLLSPLQLRSPPPSRSQKRVAQKDLDNLTRSSPSPCAPSRLTRGANKRNRSAYELDLDSDPEDREPALSNGTKSRDRFSTPKRRRQIPNDLPLGLTREDFYSLYSPPITQSPLSPAHQSQEDPSAREINTSGISLYNPDAPLPSIEANDETIASVSHELSPIDPSPSWIAEDDQRLVKLVLERYQFSEQVLDDCARELGRNHESIRRRWQTLLGQGEIGLRQGAKPDLMGI